MCHCVRVSECECVCIRSPSRPPSSVLIHSPLFALLNARRVGSCLFRTVSGASPLNAHFCSRSAFCFRVCLYACVLCLCLQKGRTFPPTKTNRRVGDVWHNSFLLLFCVVLLVFSPSVCVVLFVLSFCLAVVAAHIHCCIFRYSLVISPYCFLSAFPL